MRVGTTAAHTSGGSCKNENKKISSIRDETYAVTIKQEESGRKKPIMTHLCSRCYQATSHARWSEKPLWFNSQNTVASFENLEIQWGINTLSNISYISQILKEHYFNLLIFIKLQARMVHKPASHAYIYIVLYYHSSECHGVFEGISLQHRVTVDLWHL